MAKWMNKMGLAAINFNIDDSKIAGFNKGFLDSNDGSPVTTPIIGSNSTLNCKHQRSIQISSQGESENDSDKESSVSWQIFASHHSSISDIEAAKDKVKITKEEIEKNVLLRRIYLIIISQLIYHQLLVMLDHHRQHHYYHYLKHKLIQ